MMLRRGRRHLHLLGFEARKIVMLLFLSHFRRGPAKNLTLRFQTIFKSASHALSETVPFDLSKVLSKHAACQNGRLHLAGAQGNVSRPRLLFFGGALRAI